MTDPKNDKTPTAPTSAASSTESSGDGGNAEVQEKMDVATELGYFGVSTDPTPNENYTVQGQAAGKPTPETDPAQAEKVRKHQADVRAGTVEPDKA